MACLQREESADTLSVRNSDGTDDRIIAVKKAPEYLDLPTWSPDGKSIACATGIAAPSRTAGITIFDVASPGEKQLSKDAWQVIETISWLPERDGFITSARETSNSLFQIWHVSYPDGAAQRITNDLENYGSLSLTSDGKRLVALDANWRSGIWLMRDDDLSSAIPITSGEHHNYMHVAWTPDGKILYASSIGSSRDIWMMDADGQNPRQLTTDSGINFQPHSCAGGRYIVFSSSRVNLGVQDIWRMDGSGIAPVQLTFGQSAEQPVCSPEGKWVIYVRGGPDVSPNQKSLWKIPLQGGEPLQIAENAAVGPAISSDGTLIACWYKPDAKTPMKLALVPFSGGPPIKIFDVIRRTANPPVHWSPDGKAIDYISTEPFVGNIWRQPLDGSPPRQLTKFTSELIRGFDWSADGRLACSRAHGVQDAVVISNFR